MPFCSEYALHIAASHKTKKTSSNIERGFSNLCCFTW